MGEKRVPVLTMEDLNSLDVEEVVDGYQDGFSGAPEPGDNRSRSFWHGWRNGATDGGHRRKDEAQARLVRAALQQKDEPNG